MLPTSLAAARTSGPEMNILAIRSLVRTWSHVDIDVRVRGREGRKEEWSSFRRRGMYI
jgi:hypothetical protein